MRKYLLLLIFSLGFITISNSQNGKIGVSFASFGKDDGGVQEYGINFKYINSYQIAVNYLYPVKKWMDFETGIEYGHHRYTKDFFLLNKEEAYNFSILNVPITARINFLKYFFVNGGAVLSVDINSGYGLGGLGAIVGGGGKYDFKNGMSVFVNPYAKIHGLIPWNSGALLESGFRFGFYYPLKF